MKFMPSRHRPTVVLAVATLTATVLLAHVQEPLVPPPPPPATQPAPAEGAIPKASAKHSPHIDWFLLHGTVFDDKALSLPGTQLRIKRQGEKKYRWNTYSNSRGEFAIRVPPGSSYDVVAQAPGFADLTRTVDAKNGLSDESVVFRMERPSQGRK
jgi:hypothetical protein